MKPNKKHQSMKIVLLAKQTNTFFSETTQSKITRSKLRPPLQVGE